MEGNKIEVKIEMFCEWEHCKDIASRHVRFDIPTLGLADAADDHKGPNIIKHLDLCFTHTQYVRANYRAATVHELGECCDPL